MSFSRYADYKDSNIVWIQKLPVQWETKRLKFSAAEKKFAIVDGPFGTQLKAEDYRQSGVPLIRITNLSYHGKFNEEDLAFIDPEKAREVDRSAVYNGDIVIGKTGATIGKSAILEDIGYGIIASSCLKISPDTRVLNSRYLLYCVSSDGFLNELINSA